MTKFHKFEKVSNLQTRKKKKYLLLLFQRNCLKAWSISEKCTEIVLVKPGAAKTDGQEKLVAPPKDKC